MALQSLSDFVAVLFFRSAAESAFAALPCVPCFAKTNVAVGRIKRRNGILSVRSLGAIETSPRQKSCNVRDGYAKKLQDCEYKVLKYEIVSETISEDGQSAVVEVKRTTSSTFNKEPKETTDKVKLSKVDGKWKINI